MIGRSRKILSMMTRTFHSNLIVKYRQLSDVRRYVVDEVLDAQYQKQLEEQSAEKEEQRLG